MPSPKIKRRRWTKAEKALVVERQGGKCALSGVEFQPGDRIEYDHPRPLALGGADTLENIQAVLAEPHKAKSAADLKRIRKADRQRDKHLGIVTRKKRPIRSNPKIQSRGFAKRRHPLRGNPRAEKGVSS